ncbi:DUF1801 domain-containing protein [Roseibium sp.]|uniref:DUF1801 domain-containing protein n=1 Tax=Roseibium sp. TaxID=1936156 RepID=UPI003D0B54BA
MTGPTEVSALFSDYPAPTQKALYRLRKLIFETARENENIGELQETLKWGQPSYLTQRAKTGTTIRIDRDWSDLGDVALFVSCQSSLVSEWRALFPHLTFGGNRSVHLRAAEPLPEPELRQMITMALTYHSAKGKKNPAVS